MLHSLASTHAYFDDPNLVSRAGLVPVMALAQRAGLADLAEAHVRPGGECGVNAQLKIPCMVAGMAAGADSIDDMDLLRHGAMPDLFGGIRAPSTLGSHLRAYTWGNVRQLEHAIQHAVVLAGDDSNIDVQHLPRDIAHAGDTVLSGAPVPRPLGAALKEFEREYLLRALAEADGKRTLAA